MTPSLPSAQRLLSIGEVLDLLRPDFPDVTISKIRYLEAEGLVEPARTPSGYRKFSTRDVERLRYVLRAQQENYYPLKVIREHLEAIDRGLEPPTPAGGPRPPTVVLATDPDARGERPRLRLSRDELCESSGVEAPLLDQLEGFGLLAADRGGHYDATALLVATTAGELAAYGLEPRHLRAISTAADRESDLVDQAVAALRSRRDPAASARADDASRHVSTLVLRLHTALLLRRVEGG